MGGIREGIQALAVAGNRFAPVARAQRALYRRAVGHAARRFAALPGVVGIHLRHGLVRGDWVPGLSDVDLTVLVEDDLPPARGFALHERLWRAHRAAKRRFPMLGEVDVLTPARFGAWSAYTIRGHEAAGWEPLLDAGVLPSRYHASPERLAADSFDHAVAVYLSHFGTRYYEGPAIPSLARALLERLVDKIERYATQHAPGGWSAGRAGNGGGDPLDARVRAVRVLEAACPRFASAPGPTEAERESDASPPRRGDWRPAKVAAGVVCGLESRGVLHVIVENGLAAAELRHALAPLLEDLDRRRRRVVVTSERTFEYVLRRHLPYWHDDLRGERTLHFGRDLVEELTPPTAGACARGSLDMLPNALVFPGSQVFQRGMSFSEVRTFVHRVMFARLHIEAGRLTPCYGQNLAACRAMEPALFEALEGLAARPVDAASRRAWFERASRLVDDVAPRVPAEPEPLADPRFAG